MEHRQQSREFAERRAESIHQSRGGAAGTRSRSARMHAEQSMKDVHIIEKATGRVMATERMQLLTRHEILTAQAYEDRAWRRAAHDRLVDSDRKNDYTFRLVDVVKPY